MNHFQRALLRLSLTPNLGRASLFKLHDTFGGFSEALKASPGDWQQAGVPGRLREQVPEVDSRKLIDFDRKAEALNIRTISFWDNDYPALLQTIHDPPALLFVRGTLPSLPCFAIVGARRATEPGIITAGDIAGDLARHNICVVSGLARGIDSAAHRGALEQGGSTIAVLGCGIDRVYPPENGRLFHDILQQNAIISEYLPGTPPLAGHFPGRNRIISGLSRGVLIVEAAARSGSLITGDFALEQGRELFAIPGGPRHKNSEGTNLLLKDGAQLVTEAADILHSLWPNRHSRSEMNEQKSFSAQLDEISEKVYRSIDFEPLHVDEIARTCGLTPMELSAILLDLELKGGIRALPGNRFTRSRHQA